MFDGKERRLELIRELQATHALQEEGQRRKARERESVLAAQQQSLRSEHKEEVVSDLTEEAVAREVGQQLDFLNKELRRLQVREESSVLTTSHTPHLSYTSPPPHSSPLLTTPHTPHHSPHSSPLHTLLTTLPTLLTTPHIPLLATLLMSPHSSPPPFLV